MSRSRWVALLMVLAGVLVAWAWFGRQPGNEVVIYVSHDQVFSAPILKDFERERGIRVRAVFDTEETKSAGVMNRLIAEKGNPQADVYWANEPIRAEALKQGAVSAPYVSPAATGIPPKFRDPLGYWTGFSARARVLILRQGLQDKPQSVHAYLDPRWRGKAAIANPLFGTTTTHIAALFWLWGDDQGRAFLDGLKANGIKVSSSNGESADLVAAGSLDWALVDSDDLVSRSKQGRPVEGVYPDQQDGTPGVFIVPNAVLLIAGGRNPENGKKLIDYLLSPETERKLAFSDAAQIPLHVGVETPSTVPRLDNLKLMEVDYAAIAAKMQEIQPLLKEWTGR